MYEYMKNGVGVRSMDKKLYGQIICKHMKENLWGFIHFLVLAYENNFSLHPFCQKNFDICCD